MNEIQVNKNEESILASSFAVSNDNGINSDTINDGDVINDGDEIIDGDLVNDGDVINDGDAIDDSYGINDSDPNDNVQGPYPSQVPKMESPSRFTIINIPSCLSIKFDSC